MISGDLLPTIKKLCASYLEEIGANDSDQNVYIFQYMSNALRKLASLAYQSRDSDQMEISTDGYHIFKRGLNITNMYSPLRIIGPNGQPLPKRSFFTDSKGWYRESSSSEIHITGYSATNPLPSGTHILQYIAYPTSVTSTDTVIEFPDAGSMGLCYYAAALIVESLDDSKDLAMHYYGLADSHCEVVVQANIEGRGTSSGGFVPSMVNAQYYRNRK